MGVYFYGLSTVHTCTRGNQICIIELSEVWLNLFCWIEIESVKHDDSKWNLPSITCVIDDVYFVVNCKLQLLFMLEINNNPLGNPFV